MKRILVVMAIASLAACTQEDRNRAKTEVRRAGEELKRDAHRAGKELKRDAKRASQKLKEESQKLDRDLHQQ